MQRRAITLPSFIERRLEAAVHEFFYQSGKAEIDFCEPKGEPALFAPDSTSWQVFKNPLSLFIGGVAAVILELAEPRVRTGVWNHTSFRTQPLPRLQRTGLAAMVTVYGPRSESEAMIARVTRMHGRISGLTPAGEPYRASDPELLDWVHATAAFGFLEAYSAYVRPVAHAERARFYAEGASAACLYGALGAPATESGINDLFAATHERLEPSPILSEFLDIMQRVPLVLRPFSPAQRWLVKAAVSILPGAVRERLGLGRQWDLTDWQRRIVLAGGDAADRIILRSTPAVQACRRLGLPYDYLYQRRGT